MSPWIFNPEGTNQPGLGMPVRTRQDMPEDAVGFVYRITDPDGKIYIGRKVLSHSRKKKISKTEKKKTGTRRTYKTITKESDWALYYGSCTELTDKLHKEGPDGFYRDILEFSCSVKHLGYLEVYYQMKFRVLEKESYNGNVCGKWFRRDIKPCNYD